MAQGDYVFIPRTLADGVHDAGFTVVTVAGPYSFEVRQGQPVGTWAKDFGHRRSVSNVRSFRYGPDTLPALAFQPFRRAVEGPITGEGAEIFRGFTHRHYE